MLAALLLCFPPGSALCCCRNGTAVFGLSLVSWSQAAGLEQGLAASFFRGEGNVSPRMRLLSTWRCLLDVVPHL